MDGPWKSYLACLLPSAAPTLSVSGGSGHAGRTSSGWSRKSSTAFGMMRWTSRRVNERSFCRTNEAEGVFGHSGAARQCLFIEGRPEVVHQLSNGAIDPEQTSSRIAV